MDNQTANAGLQVNKNLLVAGGVLVGIGCLLWVTGFMLGSSALLSAMRQWIRQLERPPSETAKLKWKQFRGATAAGAKAWQGELNR